MVFRKLGVTLEKLMIKPGQYLSLGDKDHYNYIFLFSADCLW